MKLLSTRTGSYLTGNEIADAVMHYGLALTRDRQVDVVNIPFLAAEGVVARVELVIGWLIDTASVAREGVSDELVEVDTIVGLYSRAASLRAVKGHGFTEREIADLQWPRFADEEF
jgi:hypothetical protein